MAKVKSFTHEAEITVLSGTDIHFVSLVGHAANRQPFKIIKGEVKGEDTMAKKAICSFLVPKEITDEKLEEIVKEHDFILDEKDEDSLKGFIVYKQPTTEICDLDTKTLAELSEGTYAIIADLKEESEKAIEKEMDSLTAVSVVDSLFAMNDIVLGTLRQPEADGVSRKEMIMSAISNFTKYADMVLTDMKSDDVIEEKEEEIIEDEVAQKEEFDTQAFEDSIIQKLTEMVESKLTSVKEEIDNSEKDFRNLLNENLNQQFENYVKKEEVDPKFESIKSEIESIRNTSKQRLSDIGESVSKPIGTPQKKLNKYVTFV